MSKENSNLLRKAQTSTILTLMVWRVLVVLRVQLVTPPLTKTHRNTKIRMDGTEGLSMKIKRARTAGEDTTRTKIGPKKLRIRILIKPKLRLDMESHQRASTQWSLEASRHSVRRVR